LPAPSAARAVPRKMVSDTFFRKMVSDTIFPIFDVTPFLRSAWVAAIARNATPSLAGRGGHRACIGRRGRRITSVEVGILGVRAHRQAAGWARQHLALAGRNAVLDPVLQQAEAIEAARNQPRLDSL